MTDDLIDKINRFRIIDVHMHLGRFSNTFFPDYSNSKIMKLQKRFNVVINLCSHFIGFVDIKRQIDEIKNISNKYGKYVYWYIIYDPKHPAESINIIDATEIPLYIILQHMDVHITEFSSIVLEAQQFGVPSIVVHELGKSLYNKQIQSGIAVFADTSDKLIDSINMFGKKTQRYSPKYAENNRAIEVLLSLAKRRDT